MEIHTSTPPAPNSNRVRPARCITWTPQADERLARLYREGASLRALSRAFGLGRQSVSERARQLGVYTDQPKPVRKPAPDEAYDANREPLPPGHPITWGLITSGTCLEGQDYIIPGTACSRRVADAADAAA